ncbi:MAG: ABC transporter permease [Christensenellales bacterium]
MAKYIIKRVLYLLMVIILLSMIMYALYNLIPYDRAATDARAAIQSNKHLNYQEEYEKYQRMYGTDGTLVQRYLRWVGVYPYYNGEYNGILQGNFGWSFQYSKNVLDVIRKPMGNTIFINVFATILALGITIPLGIICAVKRGSKFDTFTQIFTIVGYSIPVFITAILFIWLFVSQAGWFPASGMGTPGASYTGAKAFFDKMYYICLPLIVMTFCSLGGMTRYVRASMIEALSMDCIRTARAKGLKEKTVIFSHAWRNALIPIVTLVIGWFLGIFSGSLMIEQIFGLNGVGKLMIESLNNGDYEVVLCLQMFYVAIALLGNLIIDLAYGIIDPRVRVNK